MMTQFDVSIQPTGKGCCVKVDGIGNARWLLSRLSHEFSFRGADVIRQTKDSSICSFNVTYVPP